jgi:CHASE1-domain containing sensor protein
MERQSTRGIQLGRKGVLAATMSALVSVAAYFGTSLWVEAVDARAVQSQSVRLASTLRTALATHVEALYALQAYLRVRRHQPLTAAEFREFCRPAIERHPEIAALEWFADVARSERDDFERLLSDERQSYEIREPTRAGDMVRAVGRARHLALVFMEPVVPAVEGLDLAFDPLRLEPADRAFAKSSATLSDRFQLVEDPPEIFSVAVYAPITDARWQTQTGSAAKFERGVAVALFRLTPLLARALRSHDLSGVALELIDPRAPAEVRVLYRQGNISGAARQHESEVAFVDRVYQLRLHAEPSSFAIAPVIAGAVAFVLCVAFIALAELRKRARRLQRAAERLGQYQLEGRIASGGMGTVYLARHAMLKRPTAIKIANEGQAPASLEQEVLLTSTLTHPNTVLVYDFGTSEQGEFYYAMEYVEGYDLEELVQLHGPLPAGRAIRLLLQAAGSLGEAHERGLVHRDVKPSNLMITERGGARDFLKVLDFGLARAVATPNGVPGASTAFAGTPGFAAPEVVAGHVASARSDVFSLGAVAYFLLSGRGPFAAINSPIDALTRSLTQAPEPLPAQVPRLLADFVMACLSKEPERRPQSMRSVTELLREAQSTCAAWTASEAEAWWSMHPKPSRVPATPSTPAFLPALRGLRSTRPGSRNR